MLGFVSFLPTVWLGQLGFRLGRWLGPGAKVVSRKSRVLIVAYALVLVMLAVGRFRSLRVSVAVLVALRAHRSESVGDVISLQQQVTCRKSRAQQSMVSSLALMASGALGQGRCPRAIIGLDEWRVDVPLQSELYAPWFMTLLIASLVNCRQVCMVVLAVVLKWLLTEIEGTSSRQVSTRQRQNRSLWMVALAELPCSMFGHLLGCRSGESRWPVTLPQILQSPPYAAWFMMLLSARLKQARNCCMVVVADELKTLLMAIPPRSEQIACVTPS